MSAALEVEEWRDVPGYEGLYQASNMGNIRNDKTGAVLRLGLCTEGYHKVTLGYRNSRKTVRAHILVMMSFNVTRPSGMDIDHIDGNKTNNRLENLEYVTRRVNIQRHHSRTRSTSSYMGVRWCKSKSTWGSKIGYNGSRYHLMYSRTEGNCGKIYEMAVQSIERGEFEKFMLGIADIREGLKK